MDPLFISTVSLKPMTVLTDGNQVLGSNHNLRAFLTASNISKAIFNQNFKLVSDRLIITKRFGFTDFLSFNSSAS
jgi:hypothetical protein